MSKKQRADIEFSRGGKALDQDVQLKPTAVEIAEYKTGNFKDGVPIPKAEDAKTRFLQNVARAIKISQLEHKASEDKLSDKEKLQLIKLDREFDYFEVVRTLERVEKEEREYRKGGEPLTNTWEDTSSDPSHTGERKDGFDGKIKTGGASQGEERRLKAILINHKKAIGWTEDEYLTHCKKEAGKKGKGGGRPKKYHTPLERKKAKAEAQRKRAKEARKK